jgi:putative membrane protein
MAGEETRERVRSLSEVSLVAIKGFLMGTADIIPGVSGGTIALITGIYSRLLAAIASINLSFLRSLLSLRFRQALHTAHLDFLLPLAAGVFIAILSTSRILSFLLQEHRIAILAFFLGLISASVPLVGKWVCPWRIKEVFGFCLGALGTYFLVGGMPAVTPNVWWFVFLSGMLAICAMILPGISGAFILLLLGKYEYILSLLHNPFVFSNLVAILIFCLGCVCGLLIFSRILGYLLDYYSNLTLSILTGVLAGSLRKIWPWKEVLKSKAVGDKVIVLQEKNILPEIIDIQFVLPCLLFLLGLALVWMIESGSRRMQNRSG